MVQGSCLSKCSRQTNRVGSSDPVGSTSSQFPLVGLSWGRGHSTEQPPELYNSPPESIRTAESLHSFKCTLKTHVFALEYSRHDD